MATIDAGILEGLLKLRDELSPTIRAAAATVETTVNSIRGRLDSINKSGEGIKKTFVDGLGIGSGMKIAESAINLGLSAIKGFTIGAVQAQDSAMRAINDLNLALANQGNLLPGVTDRLLEYNEQLQATTQYEADLITQSQSVLASFGMNEEQIKSSTKVAVDFAAATGKTIPDAMQVLGKAYVGNVRGLSRLGIQIDENGSRTEKFEQVVAQLSRRFEGAAVAAGTTFAGQLAKANNYVGDAQEAFGKFLGELFKSEQAFDMVIGGAKWMAKFFAQDLVLALSEVRALTAEAFAGLVQTAGKALDFLAKAPGLPSHVRETLKAGAADAWKFAGGLNETANKMREEGDAAALAAGKLRDFKNGHKGPIPPDLSDAAKKAREEYEKLVKEFAAGNFEIEKTAKQGEQIRIVLDALGVVTERTAKDITVAVSALNQLGDEGRAKGKEVKSAWEETNGVILLQSKTMKAFVPDIDAVNGKFKDFDTITSDVNLTLEDMRAAEQNAAKEQEVLSKMLAAGKIDLAEYTALGGKSKQATIEHTEATKGLVDALGWVAAVLDILGPAADSALGSLASGLATGLSAAKEVSKIMGDKNWAELKGAEKGQVALAGLNVAMTAFRGNAISGAAAGAAFGASFGPWGAIIGGAIGGLLGLFGSSKRAREEQARLRQEMERTRQEFIKSEGGIKSLESRAREAGIWLEGMFKAKTAEELSFAIDRIKSQLADWDEAHEKLQDAMDRYGITVDQLGPKFRQQELDKQAAALLQDYQLLIAAGVDNNLVIEKMAPSLNEYVQTAIKAGADIPISMKPAIDKMIEMGLLTDEAGNAYKSAEEAGITYGESLTEVMKRAVDEIKRLVNAFLGIPNDIPVNIRPTVAGGTAGTSGKAGYQPPDEEPTGHASGLLSTGLPDDRLVQLHRGERVEVTPSAFTPGVNRDSSGSRVDVSVTIHKLEVGSGNPSMIGPAVVDGVKRAFQSNHGGIIDVLRIKLEGK